MIDNNKTSQPSLLGNLKTQLAHHCMHVFYELRVSEYEGNRWRDWMEELTPPYIQISKTFSSVLIILNVIGFF